MSLLQKRLLSYQHNFNESEEGGLILNVYFLSSFCKEKRDNDLVEVLKKINAKKNQSFSIPLCRVT